MRNDEIITKPIVLSGLYEEDRDIEKVPAKTYFNFRKRKLKKNMKTVINPKYEYLSDFIGKIPDETYCHDKVYKNQRNIVKKVTVNGIPLIIKRYKRPTLANCFIYTFFRMSKAQRAYEYGFRLKEMGFDTAESIAYIEIRRNGFFHTGYYISEYLPHRLLEVMENYYYALRSEILSDFVNFTIRQHQAGIFNKDYNLSNIFFYKEGNRWEFVLIDTNRIQFRRKVNRRAIVKQLKSTSTCIVTTTQIAEYYAKRCGWNDRILCGIILLGQGLRPTNRIKCFFKDLIADLEYIIDLKFIISK
ncbi:MAG: lipopolysaccharide kinase InaA family protein [Bacteroidales bacterium]|jgi:hypothetical protein|nr:lipopolysaccharide kinase InaA family protein [Bacteroidales bacterium]